MQKFQREERENPDGRAQTYPTYPGMSSAQKQKEYRAGAGHAFFSTALRHRKHHLRPHNPCCARDHLHAPLPANVLPLGGGPEKQPAGKAPEADIQLKNLRSVGDGTGNFCEWAGDCRGGGGGRPSEGLRLDPSARLD